MIPLFGLLTGLALAQDPADPQMGAQLWRPPVDARTSLWTDDSSWAPGGYFLARVAGSYMSDPIVYQYDDGETVHVLGGAAQGNLVLGGSFGRARIGLDLPVSLWTQSDLFTTRPGLSDVAVDVKVNALDRGVSPLGLAFSARLTAPSGVSRLPAPVADPRGSLEVAAIGDKRVGNAFFAANLGARAQLQSDGVLDRPTMTPFLRGSAAWFLTDGAGLSLDAVAYGSRKLPQVTGGSLQGLAGGWVRVTEGVVLRGGVGRGLGGGVGSPKLRAVGMIGYEPPRERDSDFDGLLDRLDECPFDPEDRDRFEDWDGCPDLDNDGDGVPDKSDFCTREREDVDGFEDTDGCPEPATRVLLRVHDGSGALIDGARITVSGPGISPRFGGSEFRVILEPGAYTMSVRADGWDDLDQTIEVVDGEALQVVRALTPAHPTGRLAFDAQRADGRQARGLVWAAPGEAFAPVDPESDLSLAAGPWALAVRAPGAGAALIETRIEAGGRVLQPVTLPEPRAQLVGREVLLAQPVALGGDDGNGLAPGVHPQLDDVAGLLFDDPGLRLVITGRAAEGADAAHAEIAGEQRALAVKRYLVARGVAGTRLLIVGDTTPAAGSLAAVSLRVDDGAR